MNECSLIAHMLQIKSRIYEIFSTELNIQGQPKLEEITIEKALRKTSNQQLKDYIAELYLQYIVTLRTFEEIKFVQC